MANHLIIGLGGTGGKVLRELRKRVYEEFRSNEPGNGVYIDYIYVDSSPSDLDDKTGWKVMGQSVHLGSAQKVNINGISTSVLNNINLYPGLKGFLNPIDIQLMHQEMGALISAGIGGQRRRLGRTLIANNICDKHNTSNFEKVIRAAVGKLQQASGNNDVTFHICAGLAGGTGSGSIVDAIAQIRTWFPYNPVTKDFKMRLFLYTPEATLVDVKSDAGFYQANGYAALLELNALSTGHYHPTDVRGEKDIFTGEVQRLLQNQDAFDAAYIYTNVNEQGKVLDLGNGKVKNFHRMTSNIVKAESQAKVVNVILDSLTDEEMAIFKHGRNAKSATSAKNASITDYRIATGFEALIGYLYLSHRMDRAMELVKDGLVKTELLPYKL